MDADKLTEILKSAGIPNPPTYQTRPDDLTDKRDETTADRKSAKENGER